MDEKSAKKGPKTGKNRSKNAKKPLKKSKFALAHLAKTTPSAEKSPLARVRLAVEPRQARPARVPWPAGR